MLRALTQLEFLVLAAIARHVAEYYEPPEINLLARRVRVDRSLVDDVLDELHWGAWLVHPPTGWTPKPRAPRVQQPSQARRRPVHRAQSTEIRRAAVSTGTPQAAPRRPRSKSAVNAEPLSSAPAERRGDSLGTFIRQAVRS